MTSRYPAETRSHAAELSSARFFRAFGVPAFLRSKNYRLWHPVQTLGLMALGDAGLGTLALFASFALFLLRDEC